MKALIKSELYLLVKRKNKFLLLFLILAIFFMGLVFNQNKNKEFYQDAQRNYVEMFKTNAIFRQFDNCVLNETIRLSKDDAYCGEKYHTDKEIEIAKKRLPLVEEFGKHLNRMYRALTEDNALKYYKEKIEVINYANALEENNFASAYYSVNGLTYPQDKKIVDKQILMLTNNINIESEQISDFDNNANNYLRNFFNSGGMLAIIITILFYNQDFIIDENSFSVNNVIYSQANSRNNINLAKLISSLLYSIFTTIIALIIGYIVTGFLFGFGQINHMTLVLSNINAFNANSILVGITLKTQIIQIISLQMLLLIFSLTFMHLITMIFQGPSSGLAITYFVYLISNVINNKNISKFNVFTYAEADKVFQESHSFIFGIIAISLLAVLSVIFYLKIGKKIDIKGAN